MSINKTLFLALALSGCALAALAANNKPAAPQPVETSVAAAPRDDDDTPTHNKTADGLKGFYVGPFGPHKMTLRLEKIVGDTVLGYSVVAGNQRAFSGSFKFTDGVYRVDVREPGDHSEDGVFSLVVTSDQQQIAGLWAPNDKKQKKISFALQRREFRYNPKVGDHPITSTRKLKEKDVENLRSEELRIMRNEMYARHGYSFKLADMRKHFDQQEWYMPMSTDVSTELTAIEKHNHELIKRYEDYGREYYDSFGR